MQSVCGANYNVLHVLSMVFVCACTICENVMGCRWCKYICNITVSLNIHGTCTHACGCGLVSVCVLGNLN